MNAKISETRLNHHLAENTIESGVIRAPFDGVILTRTMDIGSTISALSPLFSMTSTDGILVKVGFNSSQTPLTLGQKVSLSRLSDGVLFEAKVSNIRKEADVAHDKQYTELHPVGNGLGVGDRVEILFERKHTGEKKADSIIPNAALITKYGET